MVKKKIDAKIDTDKGKEIGKMCEWQIYWCGKNIDEIGFSVRKNGKEHSINLKARDLLSIQNHINYLIEDGIRHSRFKINDKCEIVN